jgi:hypothetical protein
MVQGFGAMTPAGAQTAIAPGSTSVMGPAGNGAAHIAAQAPEAEQQNADVGHNALGASVVAKAQDTGVVSGNRPAVKLFMGTGVEGRRKTEADKITTSTPNYGAPAPAPGQRVQVLRNPSQPGGRSLEVEDLDMQSQPLNPQNPAVLTQLVSKLGLGSRTTVAEMQGFSGGLNEGVWFMTDPDQPSSGSGDLVLKLVRCHRVASSVPTEAENFIRLAKEHPRIVDDPHLAFPCMIFSCMLSGQKKNDLIVMRKVRGERMAELIARKWYGNQRPHLMQILERLGITLGEFHARYGIKQQHGDFQPSNVFYDEATDLISIIDNGGIGIPTTDTDIQHFSKSIKLLADCYGPQLGTEGLHHFERGYARANSLRRGTV